MPRRHGEPRRVRRNVTESVSYFEAGPTGKTEARMTRVNGALFGTTYYGGTDGDGTVFEITPSGTEWFYHSFVGGAAGSDAECAPDQRQRNAVRYHLLWGSAVPRSYQRLLDHTVRHVHSSPRLLGGGGRRASVCGPDSTVNGILYGTTEVGGAHGSGTIFSITTSGTVSYRRLYSFVGATDGRVPDGDLTNVNGTLYGTTYQGGSGGNGTVFSFTPYGSGTYTVLHAFSGGPDGAWPLAGRTNVNETPAWITVYGGTSGDGTVFQVSTAGTEAVIYTFAGGADGANPFAGCTNVNGTLYGTTNRGGANGHGAVFNITTSGMEAVLYSFAGASDGANAVRWPNQTSTERSMALRRLVAHQRRRQRSLRLHRLPMSESILHSFGGGSGDGADPVAPLLNVGGTLYGTTVSGGASNAGTIFSIGP